MKERFTTLKQIPFVEADGSLGTRVLAEMFERRDVPIAVGQFLQRSVAEEWAIGSRAPIKEKE